MIDFDSRNWWCGNNLVPPCCDVPGTAESPQARKKKGNKDNCNSNKALELWVAVFALIVNSPSSVWGRPRFQSPGSKGGSGEKHRKYEGAQTCALIWSSGQHLTAKVAYPFHIWLHGWSRQSYPKIKNNPFCRPNCLWKPPFLFWNFPSRKVSISKEAPTLSRVRSRYTTWKPGLPNVVESRKKSLGDFEANMTPNFKVTTKNPNLILSPGFDACGT